jgi:capsular exopolysaccharide synthesis family protein
MAAGALIALRPRDFAAEGVIRIQPGTAGMYRTSPLSALTEGSTDKIASEVAILQSRTLYLKVASDLKLAGMKDFGGEKVGRSLDDPAVRDRVVRLMRERIKVVHKPKDEMITITCATRDPALSARVVNTLINDYVEFLFQVRYGASKRASGWLIGQLDDLKQQIEKDQSALTELQAKLGVVGLDEKNNDYLLAQSLNSMTKAASDATVDRIVAEAKYRFLADADPNLIEGEVNLLSGNPEMPPQQNGLLQNLRNSQAQLAASYSRLLEQYGTSYPEVKQARAQLDEIETQVKSEQTRILNQARLSYAAAAANESMTDQALAKKKTEAFSLRGDMVRYVILQHDYESHRTLYEGLILRLREAGITSGIEGGEIDVVDLADLPTIPAPPGTLTVVAGATSVGLLLGLVLAFAVEAVNSRVVTLEQAERESGLPLLAMLPHFKFDRKAKASGMENILTLAAPNSHYSEAVQTFRSSVLLSTPGDSPKVLVVTSAFPGEGKSTTAINLAAILTQHEARVLLIECDLRRGSMASKLQLSATEGLTQVLTRQLSFDDALQVLPFAGGWAVLPGGPRSPNPAVLLGSGEMKALVDRCRTRYDFVILDAPPVLGLSDAINLGLLADAVVLVVRAKVANRNALRQAVRTVRTAKLPVLGFVLNDVEPDAQGYGYGYEYGAAYGGYYSDGR